MQIFIFFHIVSIFHQSAFKSLKRNMGNPEGYHENKSLKKRQKDGHTHKTHTSQEKTYYQNDENEEDDNMICLGKELPLHICESSINLWEMDISNITRPIDPLQEAIDSFQQPTLKRAYVYNNDEMNEINEENERSERSLSVSDQSLSDYSSDNSSTPLNDDSDHDNDFVFFYLVDWIAGDHPSHSPLPFAGSFVQFMHTIIPFNVCI